MASGTKGGEKRAINIQTYAMFEDLTELYQMKKYTLNFKAENVQVPSDKDVKSALQRRIKSLLSTSAVLQPNET